jgi:uncharacterized membrane protein
MTETRVGGLPNKEEYNMRKLIMAVTAASVLMPVMASPADARHRHRHYYARTCHRHGGTTGAIIGGATGALVGGAVTHGIAGPVIGGAGGALLGRHIQRHSRC